MHMKKIYSLVLLSLVVAPLQLRADDLDNNTSYLSPRAQEGTMLAVDGGLLLILNKFLRSPGADVAKIAAVRERLATAQANFDAAVNSATISATEARTLQEAFKLAENNNTALSRLLAEYDAQSDIEYGDRYGSGSKADRRVGGHGLGNRRTPKAFNSNRAVTRLITEAEVKAAEQLAAEGATITKAEIDVAVKAANELEAARKAAGQILMSAQRELPVVTAEGAAAEQVAKKYRFYRAGGNIIIGIDLLGHVWAMADNSRTPIIMGGYVKIGREAHKALFSKVKELETPPTPVPAPPREVPAPEVEEVPALPERGTSAPQGPSGLGVEVETENGIIIEEPVNRLPALQKTAPEFSN